MNRRTTLAMTTTALLCLAVGLSATASFAQQKSLKEQLVGTWTLVSSDQMRPDGSKLKQFGANPKGINVFDANGRFFLMIASADNSQIASKDLSKANSEDVGGPLRIAQLSGQAASLGFQFVLQLCAALSVSIGLLNLFPVPLLDGGHLLFYAVEAVRGRPLSPRAQEMGFRIGLGLVLMLMVFATYNDILHLAAS